MVNERSVSGSHKIDTVLRKIDISEDCIIFWFSKNNFKDVAVEDSEYDVITHFIWNDDINNRIEKMELSHLR